MALHQLINPGPDVLITADGSLWEVGERREQETREHFTARALEHGRLVDLGRADTPAKKDEPKAAPAKSDGPAKSEGAQ
jgi:hypothetical protein